MSKVMLTQEQIDAGVNEAQSAVANARRSLAATQAARAKIGVTPEKVQRFVNKLAPSDRAWVDSLVASSLAKINAQPAAARTGVRKLRRMV